MLTIYPAAAPLLESFMLETIRTIPLLASISMDERGSLPATPYYQKVTKGVESIPIRDIYAFLLLPERTFPGIKTVSDILSEC